MLSPIFLYPETESCYHACRGKTSYLRNRYQGMDFLSYLFSFVFNISLQTSSAISRALSLVTYWFSSLPVFSISKIRKRMKLRKTYNGITAIHILKSAFINHAKSSVVSDADRYVMTAALVNGNESFFFFSYS